MADQVTQTSCAYIVIPVPGPERGHITSPPGRMAGCLSNGYALRSMVRASSKTTPAASQGRCILGRYLIKSGSYPCKPGNHVQPPRRTQASIRPMRGTLWWTVGLWISRLQ